MRLFSSPRITSLLQRFRPPEGEAISAPTLNKSIETAQKRVEQRNFSLRKHTLEYDDVINKQRKEVYAFRNELLSTGQPIQLAQELFHSIADQIFENQPEATLETFHAALLAQFPLLDLPPFATTLSMEEARLQATTAFQTAFAQKIEHQTMLLTVARPDLQDPSRTEALLQEVVRSLLVRKIDQRWQEHLLSIDHLRSDVHMRTVGQKDPLLEFKHESFTLFETFSKDIRLDTVKDLLQFELALPPEMHSSLRRAPVLRA